MDKSIYETGKEYVHNQFNRIYRQMVWDR